MGTRLRNFAKKLAVTTAFTAVVGGGAIVVNNVVGPFAFAPSESGTAVGKIQPGSAFSKSDGAPGCGTIWGGTLNLVTPAGKGGFMAYFTENAKLAEQIASGSPVVVSYDSASTATSACDVSAGMHITNVQPG